MVACAPHYGRYSIAMEGLARKQQSLRDEHERKVKDSGIGGGPRARTAKKPKDEL